MQYFPKSTIKLLNPAEEALEKSLKITVYKNNSIMRASDLSHTKLNMKYFRNIWNLFLVVAFNISIHGSCEFVW